MKALEKLKPSYRKGIGFGVTSGIITTLGVMTGLFSGTDSKAIVLGGVLLIAFADSMSDAFGIHISEEFTRKSSERQVWVSTISTFLSKALVSLSFVVPIIFLQLSTAIVVNLVWGMVLIIVFSFVISLEEEVKPYRVILEHIGIAAFVILATFFIGEGVRLIK